jgi:hypothetical protein
MKYVRLNSALNIEEQAAAVLALVEALKDFYTKHKQTNWKAPSQSIFAGLHPEDKSTIYEFLEIGNPLIVSFIERHAETYRPLRVFNAEEVIRLNEMAEDDYDSRN